jgi:hypothetical protein
MVVLVLAFPQMVLHYKSALPAVDPSEVDIQIEVPAESAPPETGSEGYPAPPAKESDSASDIERELKSLR